MASPSSLVLIALRGIASDQAVGSLDSIEQVDEVLAKLKELKGLLKRRRLALAVRMEDLVLPIRRQKGECWLKEEEEFGDEHNLDGWGYSSHEAAFSVGPGLAEVVCTVEATAAELADFHDAYNDEICGFHAQLSLKHGGPLWRVSSKPGELGQRLDLVDLDGAALQLLEASKICSWTTSFLGSDGEEEEEEEGVEGEEEDSQMGAPDAAPHDLAHSTTPDAAPCLNVWPVAPAARAATTAAAAAADALERRALVRRFLADVSTEVFKQMVWCEKSLDHPHDVGTSMRLGGTSITRIERWIMTGNSWRLPYSLHY